MKNIFRSKLIVLCSLIACMTFTLPASARNSRPVFENTYLGRLLQANPDKYMECMLLGPTEENAKSAMCARSVRSIVACARVRNLHCGASAINYSGFGCMERNGFVDLLKLKNNENIAKSKRTRLKNMGIGVCNIPGVVMPYRGRCKATNSQTAIGRADCHNQLKKLLGTAKYEEELQKNIAYYMNPENGGYSRQQAYNAAFAGDRYGHMDVVGYAHSKDHERIFSNKVNYYSYIVLQRPAYQHQKSGRNNPRKKLQACYLPADDVERFLESL